MSKSRWLSYSLSCENSASEDVEWLSHTRTKLGQCHVAPVGGWGEKKKSVVLILFLLKFQYVVDPGFICINIDFLKYMKYYWSWLRILVSLCILCLNISVSAWSWPCLEQLNFPKEENLVSTICSEHLSSPFLSRYHFVARYFVFPRLLWTPSVSSPSTRLSGHQTQ